MADQTDQALREEHDADGTLRARWHVIVEDGHEIRHGEFESFHANGMRDERGFYERGQRVGPWVRCDDTGRILFSGELSEDTESAADEPDPSAWEEEITPDVLPQDRRRTDWWIEILVVLALAWLAPMAYAVFSGGVMLDPADWPTDPIIDDTEFGVSELFRAAASLQVLIPLLWIVWRSGTKWAEIGVVKPRLLRDMGLGVALAAFCLGFDMLMGWLLNPPVYPIDIMPSGGTGYAVLTGGMILNSLAEEFVWRGFLLTRIRQLSGSAVFAVLASSLLFASYHIYQGLAGAVLVALSGVFWAVSVLLTRSIWPAVVAHTLFNVYVFLPFTWWPEGA